MQSESFSTWCCEDIRTHLHTLQLLCRSASHCDTTFVPYGITAGHHGCSLTGNTHRLLLCSAVNGRLAFFQNPAFAPLGIVMIQPCQSKFAFNTRLTGLQEYGFQLHIQSVPTLTVTE